MSNVLKMAAVGGAAVETDANFNQTVLLLHGDGTNGAQNNTFLDGSTNNFTITRNGNTTQGTFSPFSLAAGEWSNYFDGNGDELTLSTTTAAQIGSGDFSFEAFVYATRLTNTTVQGLISYGIVGSISGTSYASLQLSNTGILQFFYAQTTSADLSDPSSFPINQWVHTAVCRSGSTLSLYVNGSRVATTTTSATVGSSGDRIAIGGQWFANNTARQLQGYMASVRIVKGSSAYDATQTTLTIPTAPLTAITNTSLLTCQSNRFQDNSTNAFAITRNGDVRVTPFSPFAPSAAYDPAVNGGSGYFDGTGDYLTGPTNNAALQFGTGDFSIEFWLYLNATGSIRQIIDTRTSDSATPYGVFLDASNQPYLYDGTASRTSSIPCIGSAWNHVVISRVSSTLRIFVNGVQGLSLGSYTTSLSPTGAYLIGDRTFGTLYPLNGYLTDLRIVKGSGVTSVTVPTAPLTAITNTSLLLNFTNAGIFDNTGKNVLETVGNAQIDTGTKKYGTGSMEFDGTGDRLIIPPTQDLDLTTGDFTVEAWIYTNTIAAGVAVFAYRGSTAVTLSTDIQWSMYRNGSSLIVRPYSSTTDYTINIGTIAANTWYHVAFTRSGSTFRGFLNGTVSATTQTISGSLNNNATWSGSIIGSMTEGGVDRGFNGFIDDLRITKGVARYTANFTAPTKEFPDQ
jgi:hypothetical protein